MSPQYAIQEDTPHGQLLSWNGKTLVHDSRAELEFLLTGPIRIVPCPPSLRPEDCLELRFHPQFSHHQFPLRREAYR
jgi:hypothetical protein